MDYKKIRSKDIKDVNKTRKLQGFLELPNTGMAVDSKHRIECVAMGRTPTKAAWRSSVNVLDAKEVKRENGERR